MHAHSPVRGGTKRGGHVYPHVHAHIYVHVLYTCLRTVPPLMAGAMVSSGMEPDRAAQLSQLGVSCGPVVISAIGQADDTIILSDDIS